MQQFGQDGIIEKAEKAAEETERAGIKEEIELKIANLQMEQDKVGKELSKEDIENTLNELEGIDVDIVGGTIDGEYNGEYGFIVDENRQVIVSEKLKGDIPTGGVVNLTYLNRNRSINRSTIASNRKFKWRNNRKDRMFNSRKSGIR